MSLHHFIDKLQGGKINAKIYVGKSTIMHNLWFSAHTIYMNYDTGNRFLLVSSSNMTEVSKLNKPNVV